MPAIQFRAAAIQGRVSGPGKASVSSRWASVSPYSSPVATQRAAVLAERAGGQDTHAVAVQQVAGQALIGGHAVIGGQRAAPGAEAGVEVEGGLRRGDIEPGGGELGGHSAADRGVQGPAAGDPFGKFWGSVKGRAAACWTGAAVADQVSLAIPSTRPRSARPTGPSGSRAAPARQPPRARLLLSSPRSASRDCSGASSLVWTGILGMVCSLSLPIRSTAAPAAAGVVCKAQPRTRPGTMRHRHRADTPDASGVSWATPGRP
jgi:hypothetical protein